MGKTSFKTLLLVSSAMALCGLAQAQDGDTSQSETEEVEDTRQLDAVVVTGRFIPDEKKATSEISSLIDAEDFRVTGDTDAASALKRVTGLTISRGKFVFVRGLNERYSSATLNGSPLPSPEPLRRVAPLDLFPTAILDSVLVQKTWSPQFSAEFGGGLIELRTKAVPDQFFADIKFSGSVNAVTSIQDGLLYHGGGNSDYLGIDDGTRDLPPALAAAFRTTRVNALPSEENRSIGIAFSDPNLLIAQEGLVGPDYGLGVSLGQRFDITPDISFGLTATAGYSLGWDTRQGRRRAINVQNTRNDGTPGVALIGQEGVTSTLSIDDDFDRESTEMTAKLNGLVGLGLEAFNNHEIALTGLITRSTAKEVRVFEGFEDDVGNDIRIENYEFFERQLLTFQGRGEHVFPALGNLWGELDDFAINWHASYSQAERDAPYQANIQFEEQGGAANARIDGVLQLEDANDVGLTFSTIDDETRDIGIDLKLPLNPAWLPGGDAELAAGWTYMDSTRDTFTRIFNFQGSLPSEFQTGRVDAIFNENTITGNSSSGFAVGEVGGSQFPEAFRGTLELDAFYAAADIRFNDRFRLSGGVRYEDSLQVSDTFNVTLDDDGALEAQISSRFLLPSVTATWNFTGNLQLRGGFSQTITRPQFRELAFVQFINSETDEDFQGNPFLINSQVDNYDVRLEWYFDRDQFLTIGGFYKDLENPIEEVGASSIDIPINTFINAPSARLMGFELEYQKIFPLHDWLGWDILASRDFVFKGNYSFSDSEVSADGEVVRSNFNAGRIERDVIDAASFIIEGRSLQGQSDHVLNLQAGYDNLEAGSSFRLLFNFASERIRTTESLVANQPAVIEEPPLSLDIAYTRDFDFRGGQYSFGFNFNNITGADYVARQSGTENSIIVDSYKRGQEFSFSIKRVF